jgi:DNA polymerase-3 subunit chi
MGQAMFYHLTRSGVFDTLQTLLPRAIAQGWRVMLRGTDRAVLERIDTRLWQEPEDGFLPHGLEGGPHDALQPVLMGLGPAANAPQAVALIDGAIPLPGEEACERLWVIFDGNDEGAVIGARALWTRLADSGLTLQYWSEETGRWQMKTERKPPQNAP